MARNLPSRMTMFTVGGFAAILLGFGLLGYWPYQRQLTAVEAEIQQREAALRENAEASARLQEVTRQVRFVELQVANYDRLVPDNKDLGTFLAQLHGELQAVGLQDASVRALAPTTLGRCQRLPIEIRGVGTFRQYHQFMRRLESLPRMSSVSHVNIEADPALSGQVTVQLTLSIYSTNSK